MSVVFLDAGDDLYALLHARAAARAASWEPAPVPARVAAPGAGTPVERRGARLVPHRGGRLHSLFPCALAVALPWSAAIYVGGGFR